MCDKKPKSKLIFEKLKVRLFIFKKSFKKLDKKKKSN